MLDDRKLDVLRAIGNEASGLTQVMIQFAPGKTQSLHRHPGEAWLYVVEGHGHSFMGTSPDQGEHHRWKKGDLIVVDHFLWHQHFNDDPKNQCRLVRIHMFDSILETMRHLVGADSWYLVDITGDRATGIDEDQMELRQLRAAIEADRTAWSTFLAQDLDPIVGILQRPLGGQSRTAGRQRAIDDAVGVVVDRGAELGAVLDAHDDGHAHSHGHGHSHGLVDRSIVRSRAGIKAVSFSLGVLAVTALVQAVIFALSGSVALLADLIHNVGDALTAVPLGIAFFLVVVGAEKLVVRRAPEHVA